MNRLTTDDTNSIMYHLNTFYAKNGEVWVRNGGPYPDFQDVTLVQWIRSASSKHGLNFTAEDPEHLGDEMYDALQDGDETVEGILALMHEAAVQAAEMRWRLKPIEDILGDDYDLDRLRELMNQRMTMREDVAARMELVGGLPMDRLRELVEADRDGRCYIANAKIGEQVFVPDKEGKVIACRVQGISLPAHGKNLIIHLGGYPAEYLWSDREGKDWWKTRESAESALKGE